MVEQAQASLDAVPLAEVVTTEQLARRPARAPDYEAESRTLASLAAVMAESPQTLLQKLVEAARQLCRADAAAIGLAEPDGASGTFRWQAITGPFDASPRGASPEKVIPGGTVLRFRPATQQRARAGTEWWCEALLLPFHSAGAPTGTICVQAHTPDRQFDAEDARLLTGLSRFAAAACRLTAALTTAQALEQANAALRAANERFQVAEEVTNGFTYDWDMVTRAAVRSDGLTSVLGYAQRDIEPTISGWLALVHPEDRRVVETVIDSLAGSERDRYVIEYRAQHKDGHWVSLLDRGRVIRDEAGAPRRVVSSRVDITASKPTEEALRASEERFRSFAENSVDALWILNATTKQLEYLSPAFERIWGEPRDAVLRDPGRWAELVHPEDRATALQGLPRLLAGEGHVEEYRIVRPSDGAVRWIRDTGFAIHDAAGAVQRTAGIAQDVTNHKRAEEALRTSEERVRTLVTHLPGGAAFVVDDELRYVLAGGEALRAAGLTPEALVGRSLDEVLPPALVSEYTPYFRQVLAGESFVREHEAHGRVYLSRGMPLRDRHGAVYAALAVSYDITERRQAEAALRDSEARLAVDLAGMRRLHELHARLASEDDLHAALDEILAAACEFTGTGRGCVQLVSDDGERLEMFAWRGYTDDSPFIDHFRYEGSQPACDAARRHRQRLVIEDVAAFPPLADTRDREVALADGIRATQSTPMISRKGNLVGMLSTQFPRPHRPAEHELRLIDLLAWTAAEFVERQRAEAALRESEERFRLLVENVHEYALFQTDPAGLVTSWNPGAERLFGYPSAEMLGQHIERLLTPADREAGVFDQELARVRAGEKQEDARWMMRRDGTRFWARWVTEPVRDEKGELRGVAKVLRDETERQEAEQALRESEAQLRRAIEIETVGVIFFRTTGEVTYANEAFLRMSGYTGEDQEQGRVRWDVMTPPEFMPQSLEAVEEFLTHGRTKPYEKEYIRKDGSRWWALFAATRLSTDEGVEFIVDITERKRAEEALQASLAEKEALLKEVHHRVKNNLQVITSLVNLQAGQVDDERVLALFEEARNRVHSIASIHELLYRSTSFAAIDLAAYARQLVPDLVRFYGVQDRIRTRVAGDGATLELERAVPYGLLLNELVSNACKHAFPGGRTGELAVTLRREDTNLLLHVADDGVGLPDTFDYRRASSLGLQLVHSLARQLHGTVTVRSGQGTAVEVRLPLIETPETEDDE